MLENQRVPQEAPLEPEKIHSFANTRLIAGVMVHCNNQETTSGRLQELTCSSDVAFSAAAITCPQQYFSNLLESYIPYDGSSHDWPQVFTIIVASMASFTVGTFFSWTWPSIPILISNTSYIGVITLEEASYFAVIPPISYILVSPLVALVVDMIGRKKTVMLIVVPHFLSWILIAAANNIYILYLARFISGAGDAIMFCATPTYVAEVAQPHVRGSWGNFVTITIFFGQFWVNIVGSYCDIRTTAMIFCCWPILHLLLAAPLPESPYFLLMKGKRDEARNALRILRWKKDVEFELLSLTNAVNRQISESGTLRDLFTIPTNRKALLICTATRGVQQLSGLAAFAVYTQYMFNEAGGNLSPSTSAIIYSGAMFAIVCVCALFVDRLGRKPLMTFSSIACGVVLAIEATYFYISQNTNIDTSNLTWVPLSGMLAYIVSSSAGLALIPNLMLGELFSASIKGKALSILNVVFGIYLLSVSKMFQMLTFHFGIFVPFYLFSACCFIGGVFSYYCVPETKGKTLEEIQQELKGSDRKANTQIP